MKKNVVRVLALVLVALMCLSLIPFAAHAEEHVHQFEPITVPATCQYNGYVQMICPICGAGGEIVSYLNELAPHSFVCVEDEQYVIEAGDCEHATLYWKSCSVCEVSAEEEYGEQVRKMQEELVGRMATREITLAEAESIAADRVRVFDEHYKFSAGGTGHHYIQVEHQEATCTSDGWKDYSYCDNCGEYFGYEAIPAKGHRWNEFTVTKAATCTEDGSRERVCDVCGEKEVEVLPALGHQGEFTVTKAATCYENGSMERTCTVCGEKEVVVIPAAHTWGAFTVTEEPGCYASGAQEHTCTVCGVTELEYIPAAHKYVDGVCSVCGEAAPEGYVAAAVESFEDEEESGEAERYNAESASFKVTLKNENEHGEYPGIGLVGDTIVAICSDEIEGMTYTWIRESENGDEREIVRDNPYDNTYTLTNSDLDGGIICVGTAPSGEQDRSDMMRVRTEVMIRFRTEGEGTFKVTYTRLGEEGEVDLSAPKPFLTKDEVTLSVEPSGDYLFREISYVNGDYWQPVRTLADGEPYSYTFTVSTSSHDRWLLETDTTNLYISYENSSDNPTKGEDDDIAKSGVAKNALEPLVSELATQYGVDKSNISAGTINYITPVWNDGRLFMNKAEVRNSEGFDFDLPYPDGINAEDITLAFHFNGNSSSGTWEAIPDSVTEKTENGIHIVGYRDFSPFVVLGVKNIKFTLDAGDGSGVPITKTIPKGTVETAPNCPDTFIAPNGAAFVNWLGSNGEYYAVGATLPAMEGDFILTAQWNSGYTITFDKGDENANGSMDPFEVYEGDTPMLPANKFSLKNNSFKGWSETERGEVKFTNEQTIPADYNAEHKPITLYAVWERTHSTITFDGNYPTSGTMSEQTAPIGGSMTLAKNTYKKDGKLFAGWSTSKDSDIVTYEDGVTISTPDKDTTIYAVWRNPVIISFYPNNTKSDNQMKTQEIASGEPTALSANTFQATGMVFAGWNTAWDGSGKDYQDKETVVFTGDTSLYAQWKQEEITVSFNKNAASATGEMPTERTNKGEEYTIPENKFARTGYVFTGWNTQADGKGTTYTNKLPASATTANITLYALWEQTSFNVKFDKNTKDSAATGTMEDQQVDRGETFRLNENQFVRPGFTFMGWATSKSGSVVYDDKAEIKADTLSADLTLYAVWKQTTFTITFSGNGGSGEMAPQKIDKNIDSKLKLQPNSYTKVNNAFVGWNTKPDGSGDSYADEETISAASITKDFTLYAQWKTVIVFDKNSAEATGTMVPQEVTLKQKTTLNANEYTRTNWSFNKWNTKSDGSGTSYADQGDITPTTSMTLYAQWIKTAFSVYYDKNGGGGTAMSPTTVNKGESGTVLVSTYNAPDSTKMFGEWNTKSDGSGTSYQPGASIKSDDEPSDITLYAIWRDKLNIWFYPGEGSGTARSIEEPKDTVVKLPSAASEPLKFDPQSGMAFAGWRLGDGDKIYKSGQQVVFGDEDKVVNDVVYTTARTVTAIWAKEITITYDPNGASTTGRKLQRAAKDADTRLAPISQIGYTRTGYAFTGWGRLSGSDPEKPDYTDNQLVAGGFPNDTTLYALWLKHAFTGKVNVTGTLSFGSETAYVGEILTANVTGEDYFNNFSYQWYRDGYDEGYQIPGETGITYEPVAEDFGHVLFCVVTAKEADEGENTAISNLKVVGIDESDKRIVNNGQTESDYIYGLLPDMFYSINNGPKYLVELDDLGLFEVKQQGVYRFYTADDLQVGSVNVVNWWTIGFGVSTGSGENAGSGTATMRRGSTTLTASTTITSDGVAILQPYSGVEGYSSVWIVRQDANITDLSLNVRPSSSSYGHVSLNSGSYTSSSAERTFYLGTLSGPMMYTVVFNKSSSSPKTADMSNLGLWSTLCFVSLAGTVTILGSARKRRKEGK